MKAEALDIAGMFRIDTAQVADERGCFTRIYCRDTLARFGADTTVAQANVSLTHARGTVRGMHYQRAPSSEGKLIRCLRGRAFDVAVDLRRGSATFLQWRSVELHGDTQVYLPPGCAHGFQALEDDTELLYLHTRAWDAGRESRVHPQDPRVGIRWPLAVQGLSPRDAQAPLLAADFEGIDP